MPSISIILSYLSQTGKLTTHEVICVNQNITESYEWINFKFSIPNYSNNCFKLVSSFSDIKLLYSTAMNTLWKYEKESIDKGINNLLHCNQIKT